jgi:hypothetical protein
MALVQGNAGKFSPGNSKIRKELVALLGQVGNIDDYRRGPGTVIEGDNVRIDMQGRTGTDQYNLQAQVGGRSIAGVLLDAVGGTLLEVTNGFTNSYGDGHFWIVS